MAKKLTSEKAKEILRDKSVHGNPLTEKQRKFFGAIAGGAKPYKAEDGGWLDRYEEGGVLKQKKQDNYGTKPNANNSDVSLPPGFKGWAYNTKGRNYSPAWGGQFQSGGNLTADSVRHQANKILKYEQLRGGPGGAPLSYYSDPKYMNMLMGNIYPEVKKILPNASAIEAGEAMDFIFNAGWDQANSKILKDPRAYALQEYYKQYDPSKLDAEGKWSGRKNAAYSFDQEYNTTIGKLPENERRILMNKGRDWYYRNINNPAPGVPSSNYYDTWYGRIWNTNDYQPFNPNNPKFIPKKQTGGVLQPPMAGANQTVPMMQMGGSLPGATGMMYARTINPAPSNGPYAKKTKASAQNGQEMKFYQAGLDFTPKTISQDGSRTPLYVSDANDPRLRNYSDSLYNYNLGQRLVGALANNKNYSRVRPGSPLDKQIQAVVAKQKEKGLIDNTSDMKNTQIKALMAEYQNKGNKAIKPIRYQGFVPSTDNTVLDLITGRTFLEGVGLVEPRAEGSFRLPQWKKPEQQVILDPSKAPKPAPKKSSKSNEPIYVSDPNDPRLRAYQDSLSLYNKYMLGKQAYDKYTKQLNLKTWKDNNAFTPNQKIQPVSSQGFYYPGDGDTDNDGISNFIKTNDNREIPLPKDFYNKVFTIGTISNLHGYKKPVQPVVLQEEPKLERPIPIPRDARDLGYSLPTPGAPSFPKLNEYNPDTPTKYTFTYPTGKYNEQKTMYFPTKSALKAFTQGVRGATYQEGDSWASATGTLQDGGNVDPMGYWNPENWGKPVTIPSNEITMEGVYEPLIGISDTGDVQYMEPGEDYTFDGEYVTEYPVARGGVSVNNADAQPIKKLDQLLNFTNYNKPTKGGWLNKYQ